LGACCRFGLFRLSKWCLIVHYRAICPSTDYYTWAGNLVIGYRQGMQYLAGLFIGTNVIFLAAIVLADPMILLLL